VKPGSNRIEFHVAAVDKPAIKADEKSVFFAR
jgi:hypothetical protein